MAKRLIVNKWLEVTKLLVRGGNVTAQIPITLSAKEWTEMVMIADKNKMTVEEVIGYLIRNGGDLVDIANNGYELAMVA